MANSSAYAFGTNFPFTLNVTNFRAVITYKFELSNLLWTVHFAKAAGTLQISLSSSLNNGTSVWYCDAHAVFKLFHKNGEARRTIERSLDNCRFSHSDLSRNVTFIEWTELLKEYVNDQNEAKFEIELLTKPLKCIEPIRIKQTSTAFQFVMEKVSKLTSINSSEIVVRDIKWRIFVKKESVPSRQEEDNFDLYLIADENDLDKNWYWKVTASLKLLSFKKNIDPIHCQFTEHYQWGASYFGCKNVLPFSVLINNYTLDDVAIFLIEFKVEPPEPLWIIEKISN